MDRKNAYNMYVRNLGDRHAQLLAEKEKLLNPVERLAEIEAELAELKVDLGEALPKFQELYPEAEAKSVNDLLARSGPPSRLAPKTPEIKEPVTRS